VPVERIVHVVDEDAAARTSLERLLVSAGVEVRVRTVRLRPLWPRPRELARTASLTNEPLHFIKPHEQTMTCLQF
jgi:hypothetical protein